LEALILLSLFGVYSRRYEQDGGAVETQVYLEETLKDLKKIHFL
jgi:hypothetical protein